ncbi:aspartyl/asparaginyl beta-hydroxylase domain-containing protein [Colwellia sp. RSH04]|uniref:aspartyl/asparaginyl beta-hydroxylase domain-containing protein n=1 Tax=Colwellia sp. RSH04 TaxID=2305464 RepID=UPI000E576266|nr:aspartyl/asparaginyl beta-hydroxylase domain-containing protein [Colwellia sp. RSH04]RHW75859.1 zinc chelation protein SecC [Colwellia sp. RSH04]
MKLAHEFIKLPLRFDISKMQEELAQFSTQAWRGHHEGFPGNSAIPLISVNGQINNDFKGEMLATEALKQSPYLQQVIASFNEVFGRSRLMKLDAGAKVPLHSDINFHWYKRVRIHIPIITDPDVIFHCADKSVHMGAGECWIFDTWKNHQVDNNSNKDRVHLVIDTAGSSAFWQQVSQSFVPWLPKEEGKTKLLSYQSGVTPNILMEKHNAPVVMCPGELEFMISELKQEVSLVNANNNDMAKQLFSILSHFSHDWRRLWSIYGESKAGWNYYHQCRDNAFNKARQSAASLKISNGAAAIDMLAHCIIVPAFSP